jgi:RecA-family ATPase
MLGRDDLIEAARILWGPETATTRKEMRFGQHGSKKIELEGLLWSDFELGQYGGVVELCRRAGNIQNLDNGSGGDGAWITYDYRDERQTLLFQVVKRPNRPRAERFIQRHPNGSDDWIWNTTGVRKVPYRLPELIQADPNEPVFLCEGEKDVDNLRRLGCIATTNPGGAGKWRSEFNEFLLDLDVIILPDNDEAGRKHVQQVRNTLTGQRSLTVVNLPGLGNGEDVSDWIGRGGTREGLLELVARAREQGEPAAPAEEPFFFRASRWKGVPVPELEWTVPGRIPARQVCLFSGHGGGGKSIIGHTLCIAHSIDRDWFRAMPKGGPTCLIDAEDNDDILHIRTDAILRHYGADYDQLDDFHIRSLAGQEAVMAAPSKDGLIQPTKVFNDMLRWVREIQPVQIVIASAANVFAGNENDRSQVQQFENLLMRLALACGGSVILIAHPSRTGLKLDENGGGFSGSTAWHNSFRARMYLESADETSDLRKLSFLKNQYGKRDEEITLVWKDGLFVIAPVATSYEKAAQDARIESIVIALIRTYAARKQPVSHKSTARNYLPAMFAREPDAKGISKPELAAAMNRMMDKKTIAVRQWGPPSKISEYLELVQT